MCLVLSRPRPLAFLWALQESGPIWAFVVIPHQADWFFNCWHLVLLDRSRQDVIQMTVTLLSESASAAG